MKKRLFILLLVLTFLFSNLATFAINNIKDLATNEDTAPLRIGYVESESFHIYTSQLANMALNFQKDGVLSDYDVMSKASTALEVWTNMCDHCVSNKYKFIKEMYFNTKDMPENVYKQAINYENVDLVIVMGTSAGKYFAENETKNKFMVFAAADPILSGIIKSETKKNNPNAFAHIDKGKYKRQIQAGHRLLKFKKVGVVYQNDESAYAYSGIDSLKSASEELDFDIVVRYVEEAKNEKDYERYYKDLEKAYHELVIEGIDALYVTTATIQDDRLLGLLEKDIYKNNIPTIAQTDENQVKVGATIGVTLLDTEEQAAFAVAQIKKYASGTSFENLDQVNESTAKIYVNYDIAKRIGVKIPFSTLLIVDRIYRLGN